MTHKVAIPAKVYEIAKERHFNAVTFPEGEKIWKGYKLYLPYKEGQMTYGGLPQFILQKGDEIRYATEEENHFIMFNC